LPETLIGYPVKKSGFIIQTRVFSTKETPGLSEKEKPRTKEFDAGAQIGQEDTRVGSPCGGRLGSKAFVPIAVVSLFVNLVSTALRNSLEHRRGDRILRRSKTTVV